MRVLITGASGFIGRHLLLNAPRNWDIVAVFHEHDDLPKFVHEHGLTQVSAVRCDLLNVADVRRLAAAGSGRADAAIYLAANGDPAASTDRVRWDLELNTVAVVTFLEECRVDRLVYMSSGAVYDGLKGPVSPATPVNPLLPYAVSKLAAERYVAFFAERRRALASYVNVRFFGAYGPFEPERKITSRWLRGILSGQREFTIRGDGRNLIDFMYVDDAAQALVRIVNDTAFSGTVDLACGAPFTIDELVAAMGRALGVDVAVRHEGLVPEYIEFRSADRTMRERLGFEPRIPLERGIVRLSQHIAATAGIDHAR